MHFHARILLFLSVWLSHVDTSMTAPAPTYTGSPNICGVTTVYVTVPATDNTINLHQLPTASSESSLLPVVSSTGTTRSVTPILFVLDSSSGDVSNPATHITTTLHRTVFLTHTTTEPTVILTETLGGEDSQSVSLPTSNVSQTYVGGFKSSSSADTVTTGTPSVTSTTKIGYGDTINVSPTTTTLAPGSSTAGIESEISYKSPTSFDTTGASRVLNRPTSVSSSIVYVLQTLTVIPLATIPSSTVIATGTITTVLHSVVLSSKVSASRADSPSSSSVHSDLSITTVISVSGAVTYGSTSGHYSNSGVANWNTSLPLSTGHIGGLTASSLITGLSSTVTVGPLSTGPVTHSSSSSKSINFSKSVALSIPTSSLSAHSGFTAFPTGSNISTPMNSFASTAPTSFALSSSTVFSTTNVSSAVAGNSPLSSAALNLTPTYLPSSAESTAAGVSSSDTCLPTLDSSSDFSGVSSPATHSLATVIPTVTSTHRGLNTTSSYSTSAPYATLSGTPVTASSATATSSISSVASPLSSSSSKANTTSLLGLSASGSSIPFTSKVASTLSSSPLVSKSLSVTSTLTIPTSILSFVTSTISSPFTNSTSSGSTGATSASSTTSKSTASSSLPKPTSCGEQSPLNLNFDDLPPLSAFDNSTAQPMPLFSPYHQFFFSNGFTVVPPPTDPYLPSSGRLLLEYYADPASLLGTTGSICNGPAELLGCFNFNALGLSVGCDSMGPDCDWHFTGFRYNSVTMEAEQVTTQDLATPACPVLSGCSLVPITLDDTFQDLTEIHIHLTVSGEDKIWWMDDLKLVWFDSSCTAGLCRQGHT